MENTFISPSASWAILISFAVCMFWVVIAKRDGDIKTSGFLLANRNVSLLRGSLSIAVSWIWAPAIFICALQSYTKGLPGIFWFTAPNILCFFLFAPAAVRLRKKFPQGYTLPEYIAKRFNNDKKAHISFLLIFIGYQLSAIAINALAGGLLLHAVSGINVNAAICVTAGIALCYSLLSGLRASVITDVVQMLMVLVIAIVLVPWCVTKAGGVNAIISGIGGVTGEHSSLFDPWIAFTMGIPMTLGLLAGPFADQMFFQRTFAVKENVVAKTFIYGGLIFGLVPAALSIFGFLGASLAASNEITVTDPQIIAPQVIAYYLPTGALYAFCFMAFAGLCSTMDSAYCALSSLGSIDIYKRYIKPVATDEEILNFARIFMAISAFIGVSVALMQPKLLWLFLTYGALASAAFIPTLFSLYTDKLTAKAAYYAVITSLLLGTPLSAYANITEDPYLIVFAAIASVAIGLVICSWSVFTNKKCVTLSELRLERSSYPGFR